MLAEARAVKRGLSVVVNDDVPYEHDRLAQLFVQSFPDGGTLDEVGQACGVTRERIRQIEGKALIRLRRNATRAGLSAEDLANALANRPVGAGEHIDPRHNGGTAKPDVRTKRHEPLAVEAYSPLGTRVEAALGELEQRTARIAARIVGCPPAVPASPPAEIEENEMRGQRIMVEWKGETKSYSDWASELGCSPSAVRMRVMRGQNPDASKIEGKARSPKGRGKASQPARGATRGPKASSDEAEQVGGVERLLDRVGLSYEVLARTELGTTLFVPAAG